MAGYILINMTIHSNYSYGTYNNLKPEILMINLNLLDDIIVMILG